MSSITYPISDNSYTAAMLSYACGVSAKMGYSSVSSGAYHKNAASAFVNKFNYYSAYLILSSNIYFLRVPQC